MEYLLPINVLFKSFEIFKKQKMHILMDIHIISDTLH